MTESAVTFDVPRGTAYITVQQVVVYATSFVHYVLLIRILNLSQIGQVSLLGAATGVFSTLTQLALPTAATRFISSSVGARNAPEAGAIARKTLGLVLMIATPSLLVSLFLSPVIATTVFKTTDPSILVVAFTSAFLLDLTTLYGAYFVGVGRYVDMAYQNILFHPLSRGLGLVLAYEGLGVLGIPIGWAVGALATLLLSLYLWKGKLPQSTKVHYPARPLLVFSLPLFATALVALLQNWGDITLLQGLLGQFNTTGAYYIVVSSVSFLSILWAPAAAALYPALSSAHTTDGPDAVSAKLAVATRLVNLTVLPAGLALAAVSSTALATVYGTRLGDQTIPFAILAATIIFTAQSLLLTTTLQAVSRTRQIFLISIAATLVDLGTVYTLATSLGTTAGAIGRALLAITLTLLAWTSLRSTLRVPLTAGLAKGITLAILTSLPLLLSDQLLMSMYHLPPHFRLPLLLGLFVVAYMIIARLQRAFTHDDFELLEKALPSTLQRPLSLAKTVFVRVKEEFSY